MSTRKSRQIKPEAEKVEGFVLTKEKQSDRVVISPPNFKRVSFTIEGVEPLVQNKFSKKAQEQIEATQRAGSTARKGNKREAKDFEGNYKQAQHISADGWSGIPASSFRAGMVSACRTVNFKMTLAKLSIFVIADGVEEDGTPLVKITKGEPKMVIHPVRNDSGVIDLRARAMFDPGWRAKVMVEFDGDQFTPTDVANLIARMGLQVGLGEGRPDSKDSVGMGWGRFIIVNE